MCSKTKVDIFLRSLNSESFFAKLFWAFFFFFPYWSCTLRTFLLDARFGTGRGLLADHRQVSQSPGLSSTSLHTVVTSRFKVCKSPSPFQLLASNRLDAFTSECLLVIWILLRSRGIRTFFVFTFSRLLAETMWLVFIYLIWGLIVNPGVGMVLVF